MPTSNLVIDANFVSWPSHMHPGHCFVWFKPKENVALYSIVLRTRPGAIREGYRLTRTFGPPWPDGFVAFVQQDVAVALLSHEQMDLARKLGWPQGEDELQRVFSVPPS